LCIIGHYFFRRTISTNQVLFYKPLHYLLCYMGIQISFHPFCEVVNSHEDESMPIARLNRGAIPHIANGQGDVRLNRGAGGVVTLSL
jgi:hypothetical protein